MLYSISYSCQHIENTRPQEQALNECLMNELNVNKRPLFNFCYSPSWAMEESLLIKRNLLNIQIHHDKLS